MYMALAYRNIQVRIGLKVVSVRRPGHSKVLEFEKKNKIVQVFVQNPHKYC